MNWIFAFLATLLSYLFIDQKLALLIHEHIHLLPIYKALSFIIAPIPHLALSAILTAFALHPRFRKYLKPFARYFVTVLIFMFIAGLLKIALGRARPEFFIKTGFYGFSFMEGHHSYFRSFPSSHAATAFALIYLCRCKWYWYLSLTLFVCSRLLLGEHYLSDVIAGGMLGIFATKMSFLVTKKIEQVIHLLNLNSKEF